MTGQSSTLASVRPLPSSATRIVCQLLALSACSETVSDPLTSGATHYHAKAVRPSWSRVYKETARIGVHIFYRHNYRTASN